ncbi:hypothetical protein M885DRAFT_547025 [Pelagophyceae sp. CCMP2097]|nr:hypothetical protein M885DRAFT_547025 [Pelagophyceae sp. CCMP2097]
MRAFAVFTAFVAAKAFLSERAPLRGSRRLPLQTDRLAALPKWVDAVAWPLLDGGAARAEARTMLKADVRRLASGTSNGIKASNETRASMRAATDALEKLSPTASPAKSDLLNGKWQLLYTTTSGGSSGALGPFIGDVFQDIDLQSSKYDNIVSLPGVTGTLGAKWTVDDARTWTVFFTSLKFDVLGITAVEKPLSQKGVWRMTYLDENLRVLYASGGIGENVYVLGRV